MMPLHGYLLVGFIATLGFADQIPLDRALERLEAGNHTLQAGADRVDAARYTEKATWGNFLPIVKLEISAQHLDRDLVLDLDPIRSAIIQGQTQDAVNMQNLQSILTTQTPLTDPQKLAAATAAGQSYSAAIPHFLDTIKTQNHWLGNIQVYQPLFHGGRIYAANKVASARSQAAVSERERQAADLRRDFTKLYVQASILRASISLRQEALVAMESHRARAQQLLEQGMADRTATLRAELALADGRTALADDSTKLNSIAITLAQMSGESGETFPSDAMMELPPMPSNPADLERAVVDRHPLVQSLNAQADLASRAIAVKNADFLPEIGAFGKYEINQSALSALEPNWVVGVKGSVVLFHGGNDYFSRESSKATKREVLAMREEAISAIRAQLERQVLTLQQARLRYENQGHQEELAKENHRMVSLRFEQGQATSLEIVDAWLQMQKVQLERIAALGDAWLALLEIHWASGTSSEFVETWKGMRK